MPDVVENAVGVGSGVEGARLARSVPTACLACAAAVLLTLAALAASVPDAQAQTDPDPGVGGVCSRTREVRDALVAASPVTTCSAVTDAHLATITELDLRWASITSLKEGDFAGLSARTYLSLFANDLSSLPAGVFSGLSALTDLRLQDNPVDPLPVAVSLVSAGTGAFKATAPTGLKLPPCGGRTWPTPAMAFWSPSAAAESG